jgi:hypothetical protein
MGSDEVIVEGDLRSDLPLILQTDNFSCARAYGDIGISIRESVRGKDEFLSSIISYVLSERYSYLKEIMKIGNLGTIMHINSCYYRSCLEADKIIKRKPRSIYAEYVKNYGRRSYQEIFYTLIELSDANVIQYKKPYITANEEILDKQSSYNVDLSVTPPF